MSLRGTLGSLGETLRFVVDHPANRGRKVQALARFAGWQVWKRTTGRPIVHRYWEGVRVRVYPDSKSGGLAIYTGLPEYDDMLFAARFLAAGDLFVDVGANIGLYSLLAARAVGPGGTVIAFEPHPVAAARLRENAALNGFENVEIHETAAGAATGQTHITEGLDTVNHVVPEGGVGTVAVRLESLDGVVGSRPAALVKIDAEGFEPEVLRGAMRLLDERRVGALVIELREHSARYGSDDAGVVQALETCGYRPYRYQAAPNRLLPLDTASPGEWNAIFVADLELAETRLRARL